mmetsp:Transcript_16240/g.23678  ORF Transcript_16240/g.23678 Transcript_16240/m.23678 type:complete len:183 (+) Transcript_16240:205-753(+)
MSSIGRSSNNNRSAGAKAKKLSGYLEFSSWLLTLFAMLTQMSVKFSFPSYNVALGFWGAYCAFSSNGRATFGFITFSFIGIILDIIFCSINGSDTTEFKFCLAMLIICLFIKIYALYYASLFFASIGGASSFEKDENLNESMYDSLVGSLSGSGGYYPPESNNMGNSTSSFVAADDDQRGIS